MTRFVTGASAGYSPAGYFTADGYVMDTLNAHRVVRHITRGGGHVSVRNIAGQDALRARVLAEAGVAAELLEREYAA